MTNLRGLAIYTIPRGDVLVRTIVRSTVGADASSFDLVKQGGCLPAAHQRRRLPLC